MLVGRQHSIPPANSNSPARQPDWPTAGPRDSPARRARRGMSCATRMRTRQTLATGRATAGTLGGEGGNRHGPHPTPNIEIRRPDTCFISLCIPGARRKHSVSSPACRWGFVSASGPETPYKFQDSCPTSIHTGSRPAFQPGIRSWAIAVCSARVMIGTRFSQGNQNNMNLKG